MLLRGEKARTSALLAFAELQVTLCAPFDVAKVLTRGLTLRAPLPLPLPLPYGLIGVVRPGLDQPPPGCGDGDRDSDMDAVAVVGVGSRPPLLPSPDTTGETGVPGMAGSGWLKPLRSGRLEDAPGCESRNRC